MQVRGAPLLGASAAFGLALTAHHSTAEKTETLLEELAVSARLLRETRPTAVNLFWAIDRVMERATTTIFDNVAAAVEAVVEEALRISAEDADVNQRIGRHGVQLLKADDTILTHCNAGSLATVQHGTALGVIRSAWQEGNRVKVIATETRPLLQGARLTTYELLRDGIPVTLITDNMVGYVMSRKLVDKVIVGADRIVRDAVINKIGTYTVAVLAREHRVPFYVAAPKSTFDLSRNANGVVVEERSIEEVVKFRGLEVAPRGVSALNPAFDITPLDYVTSIICEDGVISPSNISKLATEGT